MKKSLVFAGVLTLLSLPLSASESDLPDADALLREATLYALQRMPHPMQRESAEAILKRRIAQQLAERGMFDYIFDYLSQYQGSDINKQQFERAYAQFVPAFMKAAFEQNDFDKLIKLLRLEQDSTYIKSVYWQEILNALVREDRFDEAEKLYKELFSEAEMPKQPLSNLERLYAIFPKDGEGLPAPKLESAFSQFEHYHQTQYSDRPLVDTIFYHDMVPETVWEAVELFKDNKEETAKVMFDQAVEKLSETSGIFISGMIGKTHMICGIAAIQIELGKPDWAKETLSKAEACYEKEWGRDIELGFNYRSYPVSALGNIMIALGEMDAARKLIEKDEPLRGDLGSPLIHCDLAVAFVKSGNKDAAAEILHNVFKVAEPLDRPVVLSVFVSGLFTALERIGDKDLCREYIDKVLQMADKHESWSTKRNILEPVILAQCWIEDFDGAGKTLEKTSFSYEPYFSTFVDSLITLKKYDFLESFLRGKRTGDGRHFVPAWRAIAQAKYRDGDIAGALEAIKEAIDSARNGQNGALLVLGVSVYLVDIAIDIKYVYSEQPGRSPVESVEEVLRWHQALMDRQSTDVNDYSEEELLHLILTVERAGNGAYGAKEKLRGLGNSVHHLIFDRLLDQSETKWHIGDVLSLIDPSVADPKELRRVTLLLRDIFPNYEPLYVFLGEVGQPEDVPLLLKWGEYVQSQIVPAFRAVAKIATVSQIPEIERAAEEAEKL